MYRAEVIIVESTFMCICYHPMFMHIKLARLILSGPSKIVKLTVNQLHTENKRLNGLVARTLIVMGI
jgi:hypothetical protein